VNSTVEYALNRPGPRRTFPDRWGPMPMSLDENHLHGWIRSHCVQDDEQRAAEKIPGATEALARVENIRRQLDLLKRHGEWNDN
jgi:hypothetical protein